MGQIVYPPAPFNSHVAREATALVQNAYQQFTQGAAWKFEPGYDLLTILHAKPEGWFAKDEPFGFVARNQASGAVFVTFRGTKSPEDWLSNITFPQVEHPWGMVEKGFSRLYDQCSADVKQAVAAAQPAPLFVTGHSLGGALATLATADLTIANNAPAMYNFASPRTGNIDFAKKFDQSVSEKWRVANTEDIVTTVPLATLELASFHASRLRMILVLATHLGRRLNFEHVGVPINFTTHHGTILDNHKLETYIEALP